MLAACPLTFQNAVEKNQWKAVVLSGDSEHVVGAIANKTEHRVYIWSRLYGKLERILEGERFRMRLRGCCTYVCRIQARVSVCMCV
jgi:hypothetical protein